MKQCDFTLLFKFLGVIVSDKFSTIELQASYGIGLQMGEQLRSNPFDGLDISAVQEGLADAFNLQKKRAKHSCQTTLSVTK
jgi:FKBP-type peptidyl-prolyl cis-trans isomerase